MHVSKNSGVAFSANVDQEPPGGTDYNTILRYRSSFHPSPLSWTKGHYTRSIKNWNGTQGVPRKRAVACLKNNECLGRYGERTSAKPSQAVSLSSITVLPLTTTVCGRRLYQLISHRNLSRIGFLHARNALNATCAHIPILPLRQSVVGIKDYQKSVYVQT